MVLILPYIGIFALLATQSDAKYPPPNGRYFKQLPDSATVAATFEDDPSLTYTVTLRITCTQTPLGAESRPLALESSNYEYRIARLDMGVFYAFCIRAAEKCPNLLTEQDLERFVYHGKEDTVEAKVKGKFVTLVKSPA
ncbi:hypothetical protein Pmar_PMAR007131 [Perkinsus marinus ATCC 50983]|uniref:Fibronectin type-III domain-containing protein n=1 Tax=Perkinsus marinus (strain ATCC 50983 / TXsc) TaxID=423536 RepID=C5KQA6_PERM5|nr:hypothetical protein Pmar_PMAR007131 [Perkinsus marinus ATCC 50983]EER13328.1 hypothetical protein Pmar_PMAR007131 [Perkinsus marinus ATCC 50983]|eukprot:XP_002781533.1 hypothetical protein Pmar_PMAR007131 [Perkinsus marinus ATCC 50983]